MDSAIRYMQQGYEIDVKDKGNWGWLMYKLGDIHQKLKNYDLALAYYRMALPSVKKENVHKDIVDVYTSLASLFRETGKTDSCIYYANEVLQKWQSTKYKNGILLSANLLAEVYSKTNQKDSIIKYLEMSSKLNNELFIQESERKVQNLAFNEQVRREEKELAELLKAQERKRTLQLLGIAAFIITFIVGVIVISNKRSFLKTVRFLGLVGVLLIFEFISLLTHSKIEKITDYNPVLTLLILVMLASILAPAHHYLEDLVKIKLVKKRRVKHVKHVKTQADVPGPV